MINKRQADLESWWQTPLGKVVSAAEKDFITSLSSPFNGYFQLQVGGIEPFPVLYKNLHRTMLSEHGDVTAKSDAMPFKSHSIDNLMMLHVLEYHTDPHQVLREAERVLTADGKLILFSFNPISLWGLRRLFSWQDEAPWHGHFFTQMRLRDWLALLNFEVIEFHRILYRPPFRGGAWMSRCAFIERWGKRLWPWFGSVSIVVAAKRTIPLHPLYAEKVKTQLFPTPSLVNKPITRDKTNG